MEQLALEAMVVGVGLVPMWWLVTKATTAMRFGGGSKAFLDVALAGALFHLAAEESGLNTWYLAHSHAAQKAFARDFRGNVLHGDMDDVWSYGNVGYIHGLPLRQPDPPRIHEWPTFGAIQGSMMNSSDLLRRGVERTGLA